MKNHVILLIGLISFSISLRGQTYEWLEDFGGSSNDTILAIVEHEGFYYATGTSHNSSDGYDFNPGAATNTIDRGAFVAKFDPDGELLYVKSIAIQGSTRANSTGNAITIFDDTIYVAGYVVISSSKRTFVAKFENSALTQIDIDGGGTGFDPACYVANNSEARGICSNGTNLFIVGSFFGTTKFNPAGSNVSLSGITDGYFLELNRSLGYVSNGIFKATTDVSCGTCVTSDASPYSICYVPESAKFYIGGDFGATSTNTYLTYTNGVSSTSILGPGKNIFLGGFTGTSNCGFIEKIGSFGGTKEDYCFAVIAENFDDGIDEYDNIYLTGKLAVDNANFPNSYTLSVSSGNTGFLGKIKNDGGTVTTTWAVTIEDAVVGYGLSFLRDNVIVVGSNFFTRLLKDGTFAWADDSYPISNDNSRGFCVATADCPAEIIIGGRTSSNAGAYYCGSATSCTATLSLTGATDALLARIVPSPGELILDMDLSDPQIVNADIHGIATSNLYNNCGPDNGDCTDQNADYITDFQPTVIRFPSAGDAGIYNPHFGSNGYGLPDMSIVVKYVNQRFYPQLETFAQEDFEDGSLSNYDDSPSESGSVDGDYTYDFPSISCSDLCMEDMVGYSCPDASAYDILDTLAFTDGSDYTAYKNELNKQYSNWLDEQRRCSDDSYLINLINQVHAIETSDGWPDGKKVSVIYTANIFTATPDELETTIRQLENIDDAQLAVMGVDVWSVNVVGIELGNEVWGRQANAGFFDDGTDRFENYWKWVNGDDSYYTDFAPINYIGIPESFVEKIDDLRSEETEVSDLKIVLPMPKPTMTYKGCEFSNGEGDDWISDVNTYFSAPGEEDIIPDAFAIHPYFADQFWIEDGGDPCETILRLSNFDFDNDNLINNTYTNLESTFEKMLDQAMNFTDGGSVDYGFNDVMIEELKANLTSFNEGNLAPFWLTEFNLLEGSNSPGDDLDYEEESRIFHNTFLQGVLLFNWEMAMIKSNFLEIGEENVIQYATFYNGIGQNENTIASPRKSTGDYGDGDEVDGDNDFVRRAAFYSQKLLRNISIDELKTIPLDAGIDPEMSYLRLYGFYDETNEDIYVYYSNPEDAEYTLNTEFICLDGLNKKSDFANTYSENFSVSSLYSTAGYNMLYEQSSEYFDGHDWEINEIVNEINESTYNSDNITDPFVTIAPYSLGFIKIPVIDPLRKGQLPEDEVEEVVINSVNVYPNPSATNFTVEIADNKVNESYILIVYNLFGQKEDIIFTDSRQFTYNCQLAAGTYIYKVINNMNEIIGTGKLMKIN